LACIHVLWPSLLPVGTMRELAEALGITYKRLSEVTSEASKIMHTKNASQSASFGYGHLTRATSNHPPRPAHVVECFVRGEPRPQPRARATFRGRRPVWYNPATADAWKKAVFYTVRQTSLPPESVRQNSAVQIEAVFRFERPRGHFNAAGHLKPDAPERHAQRPDLDNLLKAVMDALTDAGAWHDDAQVWSVTSSREWSEGAESAGCRLRIVWHAIPGTVL
jgi:crossover junction endodeoxyribonuclease RusA